MTRASVRRDRRRTNLGFGAGCNLGAARPTPTCSCSSTRTRVAQPGAVAALARGSRTPASASRRRGSRLLDRPELAELERQRRPRERARLAGRLRRPGATARRPRATIAVRERRGVRDPRRPLPRARRLHARSSSSTRRTSSSAGAPGSRGLRVVVDAGRRRPARLRARAAADRRKEYYLERNRLIFVLTAYSARLLLLLAPVLARRRGSGSPSLALPAGLAAARRRAAGRGSPRNALVARRAPARDAGAAARRATASSRASSRRCSIRGCSSSRGRRVAERRRLRLVARRPRLPLTLPSAGERARRDATPPASTRACGSFAAWRSCRRSTRSTTSAA